MEVEVQGSVWNSDSKSRTAYMVRLDIPREWLVVHNDDGTGNGRTVDVEVLGILRAFDIVLTIACIVHNPLLIVTAVKLPPDYGLIVVTTEISHETTSHVCKRISIARLEMVSEMLEIPCLAWFSVLRAKLDRRSWVGAPIILEIKS